MVHFVVVEKVAKAGKLLVAKVARVCFALVLVVFLAIQGAAFLFSFAIFGPILFRVVG